MTVLPDERPIHVRGWRSLLTLGATALVLAIVGCGGSSGSGGGSSGGGSGGSPQTSPSSSGSIPQGNGGDQDADNNGGPSDGDGNK